jgi:hypothetical protein
LISLICARVSSSIIDPASTFVFNKIQKQQTEFFLSLLLSPSEDACLATGIELFPAIRGDLGVETGEDSKLELLLLLFPRTDLLSDVLNSLNDLFSVGTGGKGVMGGGGATRRGEIVLIAPEEEEDLVAAAAAAAVRFACSSCHKQTFVNKKRTNYKLKPLLILLAVVRLRVALLLLRLLPSQSIPSAFFLLRLCSLSCALQTQSPIFSFPIPLVCVLLPFVQSRSSSSLPLLF